MFRLAIVALLWTSAYGCQPSATDEPPATAESPAASAGTDAPPAPIEIHPQRQALFGDLHVHTSWSTDAFAGGNRVGPRNARTSGNNEIKNANRNDYGKKNGGYRAFTNPSRLHGAELEAQPRDARLAERHEAR